MKRTLTIFVPATGSALAAYLAPKSGIVGEHVPGASEDRFLIYYEGNLHGASNMETWQQRVRNAAGRMLTKYPTIAKSLVTRQELVEVGTLVQHDADDHWYATEITDMDALVKYTGEDPLDLIGGPEGHTAVMGLAKELESLKPILKGESTVSYINETIEKNLQLLAYFTGVTAEGLKAVFAPKDAGDLWFNLDGNQDPFTFLWKSACYQTLNFKKWPEL